MPDTQKRFDTQTYDGFQKALAYIIQNAYWLRPFMAEARKERASQFKSADAWLAMPGYQDITVLDPDGWRGPGRDWSDLITIDEFWQRLSISTLEMKLPVPT